MHEVTSIEKFDYSKKCNIEVLSKEFEGTLDNELKTYTNCNPEVWNKTTIDFSIDCDDEEYDGYEDIPDEDIIVVKQSDLDNGFVKIYQ